MAEVYDFMEVHKVLFNLYLKNNFYCHITTDIMMLVPQTLQ